MDLKAQSTTKMSLNDRFKLIRQNVVSRPLQFDTIEDANTKRRAALRQQRQGSARNRRLALQLANRPDVIAALRGNDNEVTINRPIVGPRRTGGRGRGGQVSALRNRIGNVNAISGQSVKQRLGRIGGRDMSVGVASPRRPINRTGMALNVGTRLNTNGRSRLGARGTMNRVGVNARRSGPIANSKFANKQVGVKAGRGVGRVMGQRKRFGQRGGQGVVQAQGLQQAQTFNNKRQQGGKKLRINRNFNARNNNNNNQRQQQRGGRRKLNNPRRKNVNKNNLDQDLDTYMAKTRNNLDADLDAYMSQTNW